MVAIHSSFDQQHKLAHFDNDHKAYPLASPHNDTVIVRMMDHQDNGKDALQ
jgi:hypothetical protein